MKTPNYLSQLQVLAEKLASAGGALADAQVRQLAHHAAAVQNWNQRVNLVSRQDEANIVTGHIAECLALTLLAPFNNAGALLDIGTGAGFPGLIIKIARADLRVTLIEANRMKTLFLKKMITDLGLEQIQVFCQRVEEDAFQTEFAGQFDYVTARAVTRLETLWQWSSGLLKEPGLLLAMKGGDIQVELARLPMAVTASLAGYPAAIIEPSKNRVLVKIYRI